MPKTQGQGDQSKVKSVKDLDEAALMCRDLGHAWEFVGDIEITTGNRRTVAEFTRKTRCIRCKTGRNERFSVDTGGVHNASRTYEYKDGYLMQGSRVYAADVRQEFLTRWLRQQRG